MIIINALFLILNYSFFYQQTEKEYIFYTKAFPIYLIGIIIQENFMKPGFLKTFWLHAVIKKQNGSLQKSDLLKREMFFTLLETCSKKRLKES